jgi:PAS domain-containing protein
MTTLTMAIVALLLAGAAGAAGFFAARRGRSTGGGGLEARVRAGLDVTSANIVIADENLNIVYMNRTVESMLRTAQPDIRKDLPNFDVDRLIGTNIDGFHKDPSHQRRMLAALEKTFESKLSLGGRTFRIVANPMKDTAGRRLGTVVEWQDLTETLAREAREQERAEQDRRVAMENARLRAALDNVTTNVMVADQDLRIVYMNRTVQDMMRNAQSDIRKELPHFDVEKLLGANIDVFHKNPAHQRNMLPGLTGTFRSQLRIGGRTMQIIANPVKSAAG